MDLIYRQGTIDDMEGLKRLGIKAWAQFEEQLTEENWDILKQTVSSEKTYETLIHQSACFVCVTPKNELVGMAFIVPNGNPTDIYPEEWSYIRFVSVDPEFSGQGIGRKLTLMCIDKARENGEKTIALHTSEMMAPARHIYESLGFGIMRELEPRLGKTYWLYKLDLL